MESETIVRPKIENLDGLAAGTVIQPEDIEGGMLDDYFVSYPIDDDLLTEFMVCLTRKTVRFRWKNSDI